MLVRTYVSRERRRDVEVTIAPNAIVAKPHCATAVGLLNPHRRHQQDPHDVWVPFLALLATPVTRLPGDNHGQERL